MVRWVLLFLGVGIVLFIPLFLFMPQVEAVEEGKTLFEQKCVACHTIGGGKKVGPDLKGVTERRDISWLKGFIQSPSSYFKKNDVTATQLLKEFSIPMPDLGLQENQVDAVISYLKNSGLEAGGTASKPPQYFHTIIIGLGAVVLLTLIGLITGRKKVEVR